MADNQATTHPQSGPGWPYGRDVQLALLMAHSWRLEIEQAIDKVKKSVSRAELDRWFRKQCYVAEARRKKQRHVDNNQARRDQIDVHAGDRKGRTKPKDEGSADPAARPPWADIVLRGPVLEAVEKRVEAARILGFRK